MLIFEVSYSHFSLLCSQNMIFYILFSHISPFTCYFLLVPMVLIGHVLCSLLYNWPESDCKHFCVKLGSDPSTLNEIGGSMLLQNIYISLPVCTRSQQEHNCKLCAVKIYLLLLCQVCRKAMNATADNMCCCVRLSLTVVLLLLLLLVQQMVWNFHVD